jgi:malate synthase
VNLSLYYHLLPQEQERIQAQIGRAAYSSGKYGLASEIFDRLVSGESFVDFLTLIAYQYID